MKEERKVREVAGEDSFILPLIMHIDGTQLDVTSKHSAEPITITLGNFHIALRNKDFAKRCIGYVPEMNISFPQFVQMVNVACLRQGASKNSITKLEKVYSMLRRHVKMEFIRIIFQDLNRYHTTGVDLHFLGGEVKRYVLVYIHLLLHYLHHACNGRLLIDFTLYWL